MLRKFAAVTFLFILAAVYTTASAMTDGDGKKGSFKISGYLQGQYQWGEQDAELKVGTDNENADRPFNRFGLRRGHLKFAYQHPVASAVIQIDASTEKGLILKDE